MKNNTFYGVELEEPTKKEYDKYIKIWFDKYDNEFIGDFNHELFLDIIFKDYNHSNKVVKDMLVKTIVLDKLYSLNIKYVDDLVKHLTQIDNLNERLKNGDTELVNEMKKVNLPNGKTINYLSFASKYCRRYNPEQYPIYNSIVKQVLSHYNSNLHFYSDKINWSDYTCYKKVVDAFMKCYPFIENYVMLDHYLWTMGKEKLQEISLVKKSQKHKGDLGKLQDIAKGLNYKEKLSAENLEKYIIKQYDLV